MKLVELLRDRMMGMYIDVIKGGERIKSVYLGMDGMKFLVEMEGVEAGEKLVLRLNIGGWNLEFPCEVEGCSDGRCILKPVGKVRIKERRKEKRVPCVLPCRIDGDRGTLLDMSFHGARILTMGDVDMGSKVDVNMGGNSFSGTVVWKKEEEVDLRSVGILLEDPPDWWISMVKVHLGRYLNALRRL